MWKSGNTCCKKCRSIIFSHSTRNNYNSHQNSHVWIINMFYHSSFTLLCLCCSTFSIFSISYDIISEFYVHILLICFYYVFHKIIMRKIPPLNYSCHFCSKMLHVYVVEFQTHFCGKRSLKWKNIFFFFSTWYCT